MLAVSKLIFKQDEPLQSLNNLYVLYFKQESEHGNKVGINFKVAIDEKVLKIIKNICPHLSKIYPSYWKNELVSSKDKSKFEIE